MSDEIDRLNRLNEMAEELLANSANNDSQGLRNRMAAAISGGYDFADTLHNVYIDFGYPSELTFSNFWNMYRRLGIAKNVVELPVDAGWMTPPMVMGNDQFNAEFDQLADRVNLWVRLKGLDTRQRVGRYAGMFMRVRDAKTPDQPVEGTLSGQSALMEMMPLYESQLEVIESDEDPASEKFGQPIMLQYRQSATGSRNEEANSTINIHASRIVFAAEGADNGWIYGIPALEPIYNSLMDLRKIVGGGAEGFYKNASQNVHFGLKDTQNAAQFKEKLQAFSEEYDDFSRNRMRRALWSPMEAEVLNSTLVQPKQFFDVALSDVAAGAQIPATILIGQQTGRLASAEDSRHFLSVVQSRRETFMTEMVRDVIDWMIRYGVLPRSDYDVEWDDLLARSDSEKLDNADKMAIINERQFKAGGDMPFSGEEIREAGGFDPEVEEELGGESIDEPFEEDLPDE